MKCKHCKELIRKGQPFQIIPLGKLHKTCLDDYLNKIFIDQKLKRQKNREVMKQYKKKKKRKNKLDKTQTIVNEYIRRRDANPVGGCISCGCRVRYGESMYSAGHYYTRGARSDLRFNENNIHGQCNKCNVYGDAETMVKFKENVIKKIGQIEFDKLSLQVQQDYSEYNLTKIQKKFRAKINQLKKEE